MLALGTAKEGWGVEIGGCPTAVLVPLRTSIWWVGVNDGTKSQARLERPYRFLTECHI